MVASLDDRFGTYGKIGLALVEKGSAVWTIKLLLMSCRVMSRGVGTILMNHILLLARDAGVHLRGDSIVYLHQDFTVTKSVWPGENVIFNTITPEWICFCESELKFSIPVDLM